MTPENHRFPAFGFAVLLFSSHDPGSLRSAMTSQSSSNRDKAPTLPAAHGRTARLPLTSVADAPALDTSFLMIFQSTMSITKMTSAVNAPRVANRPMSTVAKREAKAMPRIPKMNAKRARPPAMGWRMRAEVRRLSAVVPMLSELPGLAMIRRCGVTRGDNGGWLETGRMGRRKGQSSRVGDGNPGKDTSGGVEGEEKRAGLGGNRYSGTDT